jgi:hypothetical protein
MIEAVDESLVRTGARVPVDSGIPILELAS